MLLIMLETLPGTLVVLLLNYTVTMTLVVLLLNYTVTMTSLPSVVLLLSHISLLTMLQVFPATLLLTVWLLSYITLRDHLMLQYVEIITLGVAVVTSVIMCMYVRFAIWLAILALRIKRQQC